MGYTPIVSFPIRECPEPILRERMKGRTSRQRAKRESAHRACCELIRREEIELGFQKAPKLVAPPKPDDALRSASPTRPTISRSCSARPSSSIRTATR